MKNRKIHARIIVSILCLTLCCSLMGCGEKISNEIASQVADYIKGEGTDESNAADEIASQISEAAEDIEEQIESITTMTRKQLLGDFVSDSAVSVSATYSEPGISDISEAVNGGAYTYMADGIKSLLLENGFAVASGGNKEFYQIYEMNRYSNLANFVTVDSMMHAYHMYFSYLLKNTERNFLSSKLLELSEAMLSKSLEQYESLMGTEWESAALKDVAFFTVGAALLNESETIDADVAEIVNTELSEIYAAETIAESALTGTMLDYSQFKPRGYYEGDSELEKYFRSMMWYGQVGFVHSDEELDRCALLISMTLNDDESINDAWSAIYSITSFFAGESDDLTYYEMYSAGEAAYGQGFGLAELQGNDSSWQSYRSYVDELESPAINSIPTVDDGDQETKSTDENKGFRFMGQRFSIDESVFQQLVYENVQPDSDGNKRMLPDTLDVAAAFGSTAAEEILEEQGEFDYEGYGENLEAVTEMVADADSYTWSSSLYNAWLYTLKPLLEEKGEGYPAFMQSSEWQKKSIETFAGSYAELKHDTVLYAKQVMAEMGGSDIPDWDTRGYVEPEVEVWSRFEVMAVQTAAGLQSYGMIDDRDLENLSTLSELANDFKEISIKELAGETLSDEEYELIEYYGGDLEHLWEESLRDEGENINVTNYPAAIVTDIATDPNGSCLEVATGNPSVIYVLVYFDGGYHICKGSTYTFYQFEQPLSDRLTDSEWRQMMGISVTDSGSYNSNNDIKQPEWTQSYRYSYN